MIQETGLLMNAQSDLEEKRLCDLLWLRNGIEQAGKVKKHGGFCVSLSGY